MKETFVESIPLFLCLGKLKMPFFRSWLILVGNRAPLRAASVEGVCCEGAGVSHGTEGQKEQSIMGEGMAMGHPRPTDLSACLVRWSLFPPSPGPAPP